MKECIFCSVIQKNKPHHEIWWENDSNIAFLDIAPTQKGHTLLLPRNHSGDIFDMSNADYVTFVHAVKEVGGIMKDFFEVPRIAVMLEGMSVAHTHAHLVPIEKQGDLGEFSTYKLYPGELEHLGDQLRKFE